MANKSGVAEQVISLPKGGGALKGLGEKFQPDLHTGTGNFSIPIALPPGRNGFQPQLNLSYSTGSGNSPFGLGWSLSIPGVSRQTSKGIPRYRDRASDPTEWDTFVLSGAEDLVPVALWKVDAADPSKRITIDHPTPQDYVTAAIVQFRPRTEGLFAQIFYHRNAPNNYWEVRSKDGLVSLYGTPGKAGDDPAVITDPADKSHVFAWKLTRTTDPFGNRIEYQYKRDDVQIKDSHHWDQLYLSEIRYADYGNPANLQFLVKIRFTYEDRPDPFSEYRAGFEIRTCKRCTQINVLTCPQGGEQLTRTYFLEYLDRQTLLPQDLPQNGISVLSQVWVKGINSTTINLVKNADFRVVGSGGPTTTFTGLYGAPLPAAVSWGIWNNESATTTTELIASTFPDGGTRMIHVNTTGRANGLVQVLLPQNTGPIKVRASAWVFVKRGQVAIGTGNGGNTGFDMISSTVNQWEYLQAANGVSPANEFIIYSASQGGAEFFVAEASVSESPIAEWLAPLEFRYTPFEPQQRKFFPVGGRDLPTQSLASPDLELADLFGHGLPDILEMNGTVRYWRNLGEGKFAIPREMKTAPAGLQLADSGVQLLDADGDARIDLLVTTEKLSGYYSLQFDGTWDKRSFHRYPSAPSVNLEDPEVKLVDLTGDGVIDAIRSSTAFECFFNDPKQGWQKLVPVHRQALEVFPNVNFSDPRVKWGDMTGDGLQDIVLVHNGTVEYWPNLGYGNWGKRITMHNCPRFPYGYNPKRILIGDVDGDGLADLLYIDNQKAMLWINQSGNGWSDPIEIRGTPAVTDMDSVRLVDLLGTGVSGILWSADLRGRSPTHMFFLDLTGGAKPYLLNQMDNHIGAVTKVEYQPSTHFYLQDQQNPKTRWQTPLPFPVQVVAKVEVIDQISGGKLTTEYSYHHGYWDGVEREFRGFGRVDQRDTELFEDYISPQLFLDVSPNGRLSEAQRAAEVRECQRRTAGTIRFEFDPEREVEREAFDRLRSLNADVAAMITPPYVNPQDRQAWLEAWKATSFSPPVETRTWFHQGPVSDKNKGWTELDYSQEFWSGDSQKLPRTPVTDFLEDIRDRRVQRDALRALRGTILRTELYALDGSKLQDRPYTVTESLHGLREEDSETGGVDRKHIFFPFLIAERTTQWERGIEPMTQFKFIGNPGQKEPNLYGYDRYGQPLCQLNIAVPRYRDYLKEDLAATSPYLSTYTETSYAQRDDDDRLIVDRVAKTTTYEITNNGTSTVFQLRDQVYQDPTCRKMMGQTLNFYDGAEFDGLNFGQVKDYGALVRSLTLVMTEDDLTQAYGANHPPYLTGPVNATEEYPQEFCDRIPPLAGYIDQPNVPDSAPGYFVATERRSYDFHQAGEEKRGLVRVKRDSLGHDTTIAYDEPGHPYRLLPTKVTDPVGLETQATYDYRVLQPQSVTDPNGNQTEFHFSPLGLPKEIWVKGNPNKSEGDRNRPSTRFEYDFLAFEHHQQPIYVRSQRQIHHDTEADVDPLKRDEEIATVEYSDGFGRLLQTRTQAEEITFGNSLLGDAGLSADPAAPNQDAVGHQGCPATVDRVVVSGWQIYDNKGRVVEKYEPFFDCGWDYAPPTTILNQLAKVTMFYDPRGQVIRTVNPDGSEQFVIYGKPIDPNDLSHIDPHNPTTYQPTPWEAYTFDPNDSAGRTAGATAQGYQHHWNTPSSIVIDALGRTIEAVQRNRDQPAQPGDPLPPIVEYRTRSEYDIRGNLLSVTDPLGRKAFEYVYDLANRPLRTGSIDAGTRRIVLDAAGNEIERRDSKGALILHAYDRLNRPIRLWARDAGNQSLSLRQWLEYGDGSDPNQPGAERSANRDANRLGKLSQHYDEAGLLTLEQYDFKGNLLEKVRQVVTTNKITEFPTFQINWQPLQSTTTLTDHAKTLLNPTEYRTSSTYDALNRIKLLQYPQDTQMHRKQLRPHYNRAGALEQVEVDGTPFVKEIAYNAKGQRTLIVYGNGVMTRYAYDPQTFRLVRLHTEDYTTPNNLTFHPTGAPLQDLIYHYDLVGNIVRIHDRTPSSGVQGELLGADALDRVFSYDPLYRLLSATGRECKSIPQPRPWTDDPRSGNGFFNRQGVANWDNAPNLTALYQEEYAYDAAGNMLTLKHQQSQRHNGSITWDTTWTRSFGMGERTPEGWDQEWRQHLTGIWQNPPGNQLTHVEDRRSGVPTPPTVSQTHWYDRNGNLVQENQSRFFEWDYADRLCGFRVQSGVASPSVQAQYLYDASGQRMMKVVRKQDGMPEVTVYIDGIFEHHLWQENGTPKQNNWLHIMDKQQRIAIVRVGDRHKGDTTPEVQYHLGDHLGSSSVVVDEQGGLVNREEYFPYGETSFGSFARKRYRFTGKERDEESGLCYYGARYYVPWLLRWVNCDPKWGVDGVNIYQFVQGNPLHFIDNTGEEPFDPIYGPPLISPEEQKVHRDFAFGALQGLNEINEASSGNIFTNVIKGGLSLGLSMFQAYHEAGGGTSGISNAVNRLNPFNLMLESGYQAKESIERGDFQEAGRYTTHAAFQFANLLLLAFSGAKATTGAANYAKGTPLGYKLRLTFSSSIWRELAQTPAISEAEYFSIKPGDPIALGSYGNNSILEVLFRRSAMEKGAKTLGTNAVPDYVRALGNDAIVWWEKGWMMDAKWMVFYETGFEEMFPNSITWKEKLTIMGDESLRLKTDFVPHPHKQEFRLEGGNFIWESGSSKQPK